MDRSRGRESAPRRGGPRQDPRLWQLAQRLVTGDYWHIKRIIRAEVPRASGGRILDLGCGAGALSSQFPLQHYVGGDLDRTRLELAWRRYHGPYVALDATRLPFAAASFSAIVAQGLFHHLDDASARQVAREVRRVCDPAGAVVVIDRTEVSRPWNLAARWVRRIEEGHHVRRLPQLTAALGAVLTVRRAYEVHAWVVDYCVCVLSPQAE